MKVHYELVKCFKTYRELITKDKKGVTCGKCLEKIGIDSRIHWLGKSVGRLIALCNGKYVRKGYWTLEENKITCGKCRNRLHPSAWLKSDE